MDMHPKAQEFLLIAGQFRLGHLTTESAHHLTTELSREAKDNLPRALRSLQAVDTLALRALERELAGLWSLHQAVRATWEAGHDVLLVGCGATGRLSLVLETLSRQMGRYPGRVRAFMAGGDYALIKSVESFEDRTAYGVRQLEDLAFRDGDLLLAITEGGETPFVIGACMAAAQTSRPPWFLYCNPDATLEGLHRCREVLAHPHVTKLNLTCGAMALTGSTRMQASTVQMAAAGLALLYDWADSAALADYLRRWREWQAGQDWSGLVPFIEAETRWHAAGTPVTYLAAPDLAISLLTDTTERSPTFSQPAFENVALGEPAAPVYLAVAGAADAPRAWHELLNRAPRCLEWPEFEGRIGLQALVGFDISQHAPTRRGGETVRFLPGAGQVRWENGTHSWAQPLWDDHPLTTHLGLKMAANALSTLMMGQRGFFLDNVMTWVRPSNNKLIDRATRYVQLLARRRGHIVGYEEGVNLVVSEMEAGGEGPVVLRVLARLGLQETV
jgi:N-acetylmuramic acid 6-phosphate etherase